MKSPHHSASSASLRPPPRTLRTGSCPAFTLIEVIIVIVMLAVLAGIVVPRMAGSDRRLADAQAQGVGALLSIVGWRAAVAPEPMELQYDPVSNSLRLLVYRVGPGSADSSSAAPTKSWRPDPIVAPVILDRLSVQEAWYGQSQAERSSFRANTWTSGGASTRAGAASASSSPAWSITIPADRQREPIALVLADRSRSSDPVYYRVELPAGRTSARVTSGAGTAGGPPSLTSDSGSELDLDALGLEMQPW